MRALVLGPTGVLGDAIVREGLKDPRITSLLAVSRRPLVHAHPKLQTLRLDDFSSFQMPQFVVPPEGISYRDAEASFQRGLIESALEAAGGVQKRAAELLHIKPTTLNEMIKRHDIRPRRKKAPNGSGSARPVDAAPDSEPEPVVADGD